MNTRMSTTWSGIRRRARERNIERELLYNRTRKSVILAYLGARSRDWFPALLPEFLKVLAGSMIGFWLIAAALAFVFSATPVHTYAVLGLVFSLQATYYKRQLATNPDFRIKRCNCAGARKDGTESVLTSDASTILGIPNSVFGTILYAVLLVLLYRGDTSAALWVAVAAALVSGYLAYVMIGRVRALCSTCINITALNALLLWSLV